MRGWLGFFLQRAKSCTCQTAAAEDNPSKIRQYAVRRRLCLHAAFRVPVAFRGLDPVVLWPPSRRARRPPTQIRRLLGAHSRSSSGSGLRRVVGQFPRCLGCGGPLARVPGPGSQSTLRRSQRLGVGSRAALRPPSDGSRPAARVPVGALDRSASWAFGWRS